MKIGLVGHKLLINEPAGVEKYIYQIFNALAKIDKENIYTVYLSEEPKKELWEKLTNDNKNFKYRVMSMKDWSTAGFYEYELVEASEVQ